MNVTGKSRTMLTFSFIIILTGLFGSWRRADARQPMPLTLQDALAIALVRSNAIRAQSIEYERSRLQLEFIKANQKTRMDLVWNLPSFSRSITEVPTPTGSVFTNDQSFRTNANFTILHPVRYTNGSLSFSADYSTLNQNIESGGVSTERLRWRDSFSLSYQQPLFQPNEQQMVYEQNVRDFDVAERKFQETENDVWLRVMTDFYNLYKAKRSLEIEQENFENIENNFTIAVNKFEAGILAEVEKMQWEVDLANARASLYNQQLNFKRQKDRFKQFIGMDLAAEIDPVADIDTVGVADIAINHDKAFTEAFNRSVTLMEQEYSVLNQRNTIALTEAQDKIRATLRMSYGLNEDDNFGKFWNGDWDWVSNLLRDFDQTNFVSVNLNVPVWDSGRRRTRIQRSQLQVDLIQENIENARRELRQTVQTILDQIDNARERVRFGVVSVTVAEKQYSISQERFDLGDIDSDRLFISSQRLRTARQNTLNAKIDYILALANLYRQTFWDFEHNRPLNETVQTFKN